MLIAVSAFFGMIPAVGTGAIGYFIVKGLWEDARPETDSEAARTAHEGKSEGRTVTRQS